MKYIEKNNLIKNILFNLFVLVIVTVTFNNEIHRENNNIISGLKPYISNGEVLKKYEGINENKIKNQENFSVWIKEKNNPKTLISNFLTQKDNYSLFFDRSCVITKSQEERQRGRWVWQFALFKFYNFSQSFGLNAPYYAQLFLFSLFIFLSYLILFKTFPLEYGYKLIFLLFIVFVFINPLGEYFSLIDLFLMSSAFYFSKIKKFIPFIFFVTLAQLNREAGFLMSCIWLVFNSDYKKVLLSILISLSIFSLLNFDIIKCILNPNFYSLFYSQEGQFGFAQLTQVGNNINLLSLIKVLSVNFLIPFGFIFYLLFTSKNINKALVFITVIYLIVFIIAVPLQQIAVRLLLLPILLASIYFKNSDIKH